MEELLLLSELTTYSVSIVTKKYIELEGTRYFVGEPHRCAYLNSTYGRTAIATALAEPYLSAVMTMWGTEPTVTEPAED